MHDWLTQNDRYPGVFAADTYTSLPDGTDLQRVTHNPANEINVDWGVGSE